MRSLEPNERRTIRLGAAVVVTAAFVVLVLQPLGRRWTEREALIAATRAQLARVTALDGRADSLAAAARALDAKLDAGGTRIVRARSAPLAASALQAIVREFADGSGVTVTRLDAAGAPVASASGMAIPATLSAQADIYGIADFLRRLQHGPWLLEITDLTVVPNPVLRGNILQVSIGLLAPVALEP